MEMTDAGNWGWHSSGVAEGKGEEEDSDKEPFCDELEPGGRLAGSPQQTGSHQEL